MRSHSFDVLIYALAVGLTVAAYLKDPGLPRLGLWAGWHMFLDILPRLAAALVMTGMLQVLIEPQWIERGLGREAGDRGIFLGALAGVVTPGGPMVSFPVMLVFQQGGASVSSLVAYVTSWSLFGFQRIVTWEIPFMGWRFVTVRVLASFALPILAGYVVRLLYRD